MDLPTSATTLTTLLNSLHSHLQSQTQFLPTLHAQLGLPPSALEDELKDLQQQLVQGVELQVNKRRQEVERWVAKCDEVESECIHFHKSLGGNVKATGSSLNDLKENALPLRYETLSDYKEKLRQLYHTKLEQLHTLSNRIQVLARTLGTEYFPQDVKDPILAPGDTPGGPNQDVTPERFMKLEKELVRGKAEVQKRLNQLSGIFVQIDWLYTELGMEPPSLDDSSPPQAFGLSSSLARSTSPSGPSSDPFLVSTPTPSGGSKASSLFYKEDISVSPEYEYKQIFARYVLSVEELESLEAAPPSNGAPVGLSGVEPTQALLTWASNLQTSLEDTKRRREAHIQAMYDQLECLWRRLGVSDEDMDMFVEAHRGSTQETVQEYEEELERMLELKRERMGTFVESAREEIVKLWDDLLVGEEERADFPPFADDEYTEELLTIHEDEVRRLKEERKMKAPLLSSIKKYFEICNEEKELAASAADQSRLTGRGSRDPGRLLREEKMRKRVSKEKPRLEQDLAVSIPAWEEANKRPFLVNGARFMELLSEAIDAADQEKENRRRPPGRTGSVPARATTPTGHSTARSGTVTPAVRSSASLGGGSSSVPSKRQRIGENGASLGSVPRYAGARAPLGNHRGNSGDGAFVRSSSPTKIPTKGPTSRVASLAMVVPKPGTPHHALGHGRVPGSVIYGAGVTGIHGSGASAFGRTASGYRTASGAAAGAVAAGKATRAKRESFKPRPSMDAVDPIHGHGAGAGASHGRGVGATAKRWQGFTVNEEDEY